jgi:anti-anti-sigma factor
MLKPTVQIHNVEGFLVAEFWDCLRLDPAPIQELRKKYEAHVLGNGRPELVIDLLGVGFAGSAALGHFVVLHKFARQRNGRLIFCNVDPTVFEAFRVSKLDPLFTFVADRPTALARAATPPPPTGGDVQGDGTPASAPDPSEPKPKEKPARGSALGEFRRRKSS